MAYNKLTAVENEIIEHKATEAPFSGEFDNFYEPGTYICRRCNTPLFSSTAKFDAGCGWPSFEAYFPNVISRIADTDGYRTEIICRNCSAHLGHVFVGEQLTATNTRHCVNSLSIRFIPEKKELPKVKHA